MGINLDFLADTAHDGTDNGVLDDWKKIHRGAIRVLTLRELVNEGHLMPRASVKV